MNLDLFESQSSHTVKSESLALPDANVILYRNFFSYEKASELFRRLRSEIAWRQEKVNLYGRQHDIPRLSAWYGDNAEVYTYSGLRSVASAWTTTLDEVKKEVESNIGVGFNSVLANLYRTGADGVSWHSDDEKELGPSPVIASVSLGESRVFQMKHKTNKNLKYSIPLNSGSLLLMSGATQHNWLHQIPKTKKLLNERINLTFRTIVRPFQDAVH